MVSPDLSMSSPPIKPTTNYSALIGRTIDNTALAAFMTCPRKYYYSMMLHRRRDGVPTPSLCYGSGWHVAMETHYKAPAELTKAELIDLVRGEVGRRWTGSTDNQDYRTFDRCIVEYERYLDKYGLPWNEPGKTLGWPSNPMVEIAIELPVPGARHPYTGKLDRILDANGQYLIEDHKTASMLRNDYFKGFEMDNQMIGYAVLAELATGVLIAGVRINAHIIRKSDSVFERRTVPFTQERLRAWNKNYDRWLRRIENSVSEAIALKAESLDPADAFPQNFAACAGKYGMCTYADVCSMPPRLQEITLETYYNELPWNPLEAPDEAVE